MLAIPSLAMTLSAGGIAVITNSIGPQATAALGASLQLGGYLLLPAMAIASATTTVAAQIVGHGVLEQLRTICRVGFGMCLAVTVSLLIAVLAGGATLLQWFLPEDPVAMDLAMHAHTIVLLTWGSVWLCARPHRRVPRHWRGGASHGPRRRFDAFHQSSHRLLGPKRCGLDALWWSFPISAVVVLAGAAICFRRSIPAGR
ncbi:MAG: MATE family efflux transporter [Gammaproteobacteria bacterium]